MAATAPGAILKSFTADRPTVAEQVTERLWAKVTNQLSAKGFGSEKIGLLQSSTVDPSKYAEYCNVAVALMREIANLKQAEAATLLREIWSAK